MKIKSLTSPGASARSSDRVRFALFCFVAGFVSLGLGKANHPPGRETGTSLPDRLMFAVIGDYGVCGSRGGYALTCTAEKAVAAMVYSWQPMAIFTTGDNFYDPGPDVKIRNPYRDDIAAGKFFPSFGNHDWLEGTIGPTLAYFRLSSPFYKKEFSGLLTAYLLDTNPGDPAGDSATSRQAQWFRDRLASSSTAWNVVFNHQPPYCSCGYGSSSEYRWIAAPGVDVVFSGHDHAYERLEEPNADSTATIPYVVVGTSGALLELGCKTALPGQRKVIYGVYGAVKLVVTRTTLTVTFYDLNGTARDSFTLTKTRRIADAGTSLSLHPAPK